MWHYTFKEFTHKAHRLPADNPFKNIPFLLLEYNKMGLIMILFNRLVLFGELQVYNRGPKRGVSRLGVSRLFK